MTDDLRKLLQELHDSEDVKGSALIDVEGTTIASTLPDTIDIETTSAVVASTLKVGEDSLQGFGYNNLQQIVLKGKDCFIILRSVTKENILLVLTSGETNPASTIERVKEVAVKITQAVGA